MKMRTAVVLAGGLGTRVAHLTGEDRPKAMLPVDGRPFVDVKLAELAASGFDAALLLVGQGAHALRAHVGAAESYGLRVSVVQDGPVLLGTGGAVRAVLEDVPDPFWLTYGDTLLDVPVERGEELLHRMDVDAVMTVLENADRWETSNVSVEDGVVTDYEKGDPEGTRRFIDYGMLLLRHCALASWPAGTAFDLGEPTRELVRHGRLAALPVTERFHDIGTETAWRETDAWARDTGYWSRLMERIEARRT